MWRLQFYRTKHHYYELGMTVLCPDRSLICRFGVTVANAKKILFSLSFSLVVPTLPVDFDDLCNEHLRLVNSF